MKLGVMCSGNGTNFENILRSCSKDEVVAMIYNTKNCGAVQRAAKFGIPHCYSLLPKYKGLHAIEQALDSNDIFTGVSVHYVNEELDGGEIIEQRKVPIYDGDDLEILTKRIQRQEYCLLPRAIENVKYKIQTGTN